MSYLRQIPFSGDVLEEVSHERGRQNHKWGEQNHPDGTRDDRRLLRDTTLPTWGTICYRARNLTDAAAEDGTVTFLDILLEEVAEAFSEDVPARLRAELIQVAAVAVAWIEAIDRRAAGGAAQTKPPRIPEPGQWGVVKASFDPTRNGEPHKAIKDGAFVRHGNVWRAVRDGYGCSWDDLIDPVLVREGVES